MGDERRSPDLAGCSPQAKSLGQAGRCGRRQSPLRNAGSSSLEARAPIFGLATLKAAPFVLPASGPRTD